LPLGDAFYREDWKFIDFVVITSVVAVWAFFGGFAGVDKAFQYNLRAGGYLQVIAEAFGDFGFTAAQ
jgi:hypothetical protein